VTEKSSTRTVGPDDALKLDVQDREGVARRDIAELATSDAVTARVTYGLVFGDACRTAAWIARILQRRGWPGRLLPCPACGT
jgi:hypothetical protein